jgi:hypothetical protein
MPFDGGTFPLWLVLNVVVFVVLLGMTLQLAVQRDDRAPAVLADDDALRVDFRTAA